ncbi:putative bifunctional diguanylate cyclase/phosphodiesterase [Colwellia polaris]|jgi:diguanylate cyclase (GGDEF)-like protein|uniref:putative bifunctional diguanylate cyclase/phosphodiesterase n=1 Tax=Colwellia polaris TaxID=326537 RepID=UPI000A16EF43|nr:EAL domain-containing protein [Colwellia polaris]|tara:strand:+ start:4992 stop:6935 length:1944 start_codon:yes stop_codon:yes gene_type:complete
MSKSLSDGKSFYKDEAELLYGNAKSGIIVTLLASTILVFAFDTPEVHTQKLYWWIGILALVVARLMDLYSWKKHSLNVSYNAKNFIHRFIVGAILSSLMWCSYCIYISRYASSTELASTIIVVSAFAGGASTILAANKSLAMGYAAIMLAPFSVALVLSSQEYQFTLGLLGLAFSLVMVMTARKSADFTSHAIRLKNDNAELVNKMEQKVARRTQKIYQLSNLDPLTGLFNRSAFMSHMQEQLDLSAKNSIPLALLFIDLDGFKKINDTLGHQTGDKVLKNTAERLKALQGDQQLLCRWGGDEFLITFMAANEDAALAFANSVIEKVSESYDFENNRLFISATIGIAISPNHTDSADELIQLADTAMYNQKKLSPSSVGLFNSELGQRIVRENQLKVGLSKAIEKQQLRLVYQPIVASKSHQVVAFEALLRWDFAGENIPPDKFIPIAEQYGLIINLGTWVLQQSCIAAAAWQALNNDTRPSVSVNVSVLQLYDENFINIVALALKNAKLTAENLTIEITESIFSNDKIIILKCIKTLQKMGVKVSIDDFGTEYSSLSVIQSLAANTLKIDRSFVNMLDTNGKVIIEAVKHMAVKLDYAVVAEGVETQEQAEQLSALDIEMLQGYFFSKPIELHDVEDYLLNNSPKN